MAHYVLSDIHGEAERFHAMLEKIGFSREDRLYIIGDVLDRGPEGISLLREIMETPNMQMILGNHEYMCLDYFAPTSTEVEIRRWNKNGNEPTLAAYHKLSREEQENILAFLKELPVHLELTVNGKDFYLVHGFPGENVHDKVWGRPTPDSPNPFPGRCLIVGHTPVSSLGRDKEEKAAYLLEMEQKGEKLRIRHLPGFIDIDCGCGHSMASKALACLRLEDMAEFYV